VEGDAIKKKEEEVKKEGGACPLSAPLGGKKGSSIRWERRRRSSFLRLQILKKRIADALVNTCPAEGKGGVRD